MSTKGYVLAIGSVCIDEYYYADGWVSEGSKLMVRNGEKVVGGMIPNAACVFSTLGVPTKFFDRLNNSELSHRLLKDLQDYGLDTSPVQFDDQIPDSKCLIISTPTDRTILVAVEEKAKIKAAEPLLGSMKEADYIYTIPRDMLQFNEPIALLNDLKASETKIIFDVEESNAGGEFNNLISMANILFFNEFGFKTYCGERSEDDCLNDLFDLGVEIVTITMGNNGSRTFTANDEARCPAYILPLVDPTGAGDTYNAAFIYCIIEKYDIHYAAKFANVAAGYAVSRHGPKSGAKSAEFIKELLSQQES